MQFEAAFYRVLGFGLETRSCPTEGDAHVFICPTGLRSEVQFLNEPVSRVKNLSQKRRSDILSSFASNHRQDFLIL